METSIFTAENTDAVLIEKILSGEKALFEVIIRRFNPSLYKVARAFGYNHQDAEDLMQETYLTTFTELKNFEGRSGLKTWVTKILVNKCIYRQKYGSYSREKPAGDAITDNNIPMHQSQPAPDKTIINREFARLLETQLQEIPAVYKTVFIVREVEGYNVADTAALLDITPVNVKVRLSRAKAMLQQKMEKYYTGADIYEFNLVYCDAIVTAVLDKISKTEPHA